MNIICFGQGNWDVTWTEKQQHSVALAERGHRVLYVDPSPVATDTLRDTAAAAIRPLSGVREIEAGSLYVYTPRWLPLLGHKVNHVRQQRVLRRLVRRLGFDDATALVFRPDVGPLVSAAGCTSLVYYAVDEWTTQGLPEEAETLRALENEMLRAAGVALGVSPRLVQRFRQIQPRSYMLENGVDPEHFSLDGLKDEPPHPLLAKIARPRIGLVGQIDDRVDQDLLLGVAQARSDWHLVLIGRTHPEVETVAFDAQPNVHRVPFQTYDALPSVLRELDVCLVPYRPSEQAHACNPAKIFEYVAAGKPVVSTPLEGIVACRPVVELAATIDEFVEAIERCLHEPAARRRERIRLAYECRWEVRTDELEQRLNEARDVGDEQSSDALAALAGAE
jgi:glycosyltransferase involved in cell wall biosynthesis